MAGIFKAVDKLKPVFDVIYKVFLVICKLLLIIDIAITSFSVLGRYVSFIPDPAWSEEVILTCMTYMAVLAAALAIRRNAHIRMTAFDQYLPKKLLLFLDILSDIMVLTLAVIMITIGWKFAAGLGSKGTYVSMPWLSKFWMYLPIPLAGAAMFIFELEIIYGHIKQVFGFGEEEKK